MMLICLSCTLFDETHAQYKDFKNKNNLVLALLDTILKLILFGSPCSSVLYLYDSRRATSERNMQLHSS